MFACTREGLGMCMEAVNSEAPGGLHGFEAARAFGKMI